jgi:GxxExxY protein
MHETEKPDLNVELRKSGMNDEGQVMLPDRELTAQVIRAAIAVHKALGPGFLESIYEEAFCLELASQNIPFERQKVIRVVYRDQMIGEHRLDVFVAERVVVELKAISALEHIHFAIVRSYMKATHATSGLLLNFAAMPLTVKRVGPERLNPS